MGLRNALYYMLVLLYTSSMTIAKYKSNLKVVHACKYHVVWCPKYRRKVLTEEIQAHLKVLIEEVCKSRDAEILALETMPDQVHLLVQVDPQFGIAKLVREIKGKSSRVLRGTYKSLKTRLPTLWTNSYFVATVGGAPLSVIRQYVENQKKV